ncbi:hypothetical protein EB06_01609 [Enterococcus cecorum]|uniref:AbrB family transcriptional regulator n=1 Tax=Enterococcus cecorum TaxID=44008 RepID=UPI000DEBD0FF|nr:AbrB family transcriptional regulator [Enterococcus cecorum]RBR30506.1 hypothetical protein EB06_01609 [Enterococcus cecorum]
MGNLKVRKIDNGVGVILPEEFGLQPRDILSYRQENHLLIIDTSLAALEHDRELIEESFTDFKKGLLVSEEALKMKFGKYEWR